MTSKIITIDGPAGAGKTTVSKALSKKLGCIYVDTGALYRGVAYEINRQNIDWENDTALDAFLQKLDLNFEHKDGNLILVSYGKDISGFIRTPEISMLASSSSAKPLVRKALLDIQRNIGHSQDAVFEGRDMGTVVFPDAQHKFFLFADLTIRAKRRYDEMQEASKDMTQVQKEMETRDTNDSQRKEAPLKPASDAVKIDSTSMTIEQVVDHMILTIETA